MGSRITSRTMVKMISYQLREVHCILLLIFNETSSWESPWAISRSNSSAKIHYLLLCENYSASRLFTYKEEYIYLFPLKKVLGCPN